MNSRYIAHAAKGYIPNLVLDFTDLSYKVLKNIQFSIRGMYISMQARDSELIYFKNKIGKWIKCKYYKKQNIFLDFQDYIVRLTPYLSYYFLLKKEKFIHSLLSLEEDLRISIETAEKEEWNEKQKEFELNLKRIEQENRRKKEVYDGLVLKTEQFIKNSSDFKYYREMYSG